MLSPEHRMLGPEHKALCVNTHTQHHTFQKHCLEHIIRCCSYDVQHALSRLTVLHLFEVIQMTVDDTHRVVHD